MIEKSRSQVRYEKRELAKLLAEKERRRHDDPLRYAQYHDKQKEFFEAPNAIRVLFWGNRVGKTEGSAMEVSRYLLGKHEHREVKLPVEVWCASPSYDVQEETTQKALLNYIPDTEIEHIEYLRGRIIRKMLLRNGSTVTFKSYEQGREKFQGAGKRLIWFDEEPPQDIYDESFVRVAAGQPLDIIMSMTPIKGLTWVYNRLYLDTTGDIFVSTAGWDDNPFLTEDQKNQMSRGLSAEALRVRRNGEFVKRVGMVCSWFDRQRNIKKYTEYDPTWQYYEVFDGGFSDPAAWLLIGIDTENSIHVINGFRKKELLAPDIVEQRNIRRGGLTIINGWTDNDNPRLQADLAKLGMPLIPVVKDKGQNASWDELLAEKLAEYGRVVPATGKPRLYISDSLVDYNENGEIYNWLMSEIENLVWQEQQHKDGSEIKPTWDDHRRFGHHFDGIRALAYFVVSYIKPMKPYNKQRGGRARMSQINFMVS